MLGCGGTFWFCLFWLQSYIEIPAPPRPHFILASLCCGVWSSAGNPAPVGCQRSLSLKPPGGPSQVSELTMGQAELWNREGRERLREIKGKN